MVTPLDEAIKTGGIRLTDIYNAPAQPVSLGRKDPMLTLGHGFVRVILKQPIQSGAGSSVPSLEPWRSWLNSSDDIHQGRHRDGRLGAEWLYPGSLLDHNDLYRA
jgi:hypothetical protein